MKDLRRRRAVPTGWPLLLALCLVLSACGGDTGVGDQAEPTGTADLADRVFVSTELVGRELVAGSEIRLTFQDDGQVSVHAGCNTLVGTATWDEDVLVVAQPMASTMMACSDELMAQDDWLASFLASEPRLRLDGGTLTLGDADEGLVLQEQ